MTHDEMIAVIQADKDGKVIQYFCDASGRWIAAKTPQWDFQNTQYRIKPEPLECWVNVYEGVMRVHTSEAGAKEAAQSYALRVAVHMKEVES